MDAPLLSPELRWLTYTALMTALLWVPYVLQLIREMGIVPALMDRFHDTPLKAAWAQRAKRAHTNAVENLVVFAALVFAVHGSASGTTLTAAACEIYFTARAAHYVVYVAALPLVRTLLFVVGVGCQVALAGVLLGVFH